MRIKLNSSLIVNAVIVIATVLLIAEYFTNNPIYVSLPDNTGFKGYTWVDSHLKPIDEEIPDSIPHRQYKRLLDSVTTLRKLKNGDFWTASSYCTVGFFGTYSSNYCNNCTLKFRKGWIPSYSWDDLPIQYYIKLSGWKLNPTPNGGYDSTKFHVEHGQSYLRKLMADSIHKDKNGHSEKAVSYHDIPVSFRYNHADNCIMIPVKKSTKQVFDYIFMAFGFLTGAYFVVFIFGGVVKFLIDVYRGKTFTLGNVRRLKLIGFSLAIYSLGLFLINLSMLLILHRYFTPDVILNKDSLPNWQMLAAIIIFLVLYKAFHNGKRIKDEHDLVI